LELFCKTVEEHKPERSHLVPPILLGLAKHPVVDKYDLSSLKTILSAAAPASVEIEKAVEKRIGCIVKQGWGMSELSPLGTLSSDHNVKPGSVGPLVASTHGKVVDNEGKSLGPNQQGELLIKGPQVMMGYWNEPEKTAECLSLTSGWLRTGDVVYYDEDGFFYVVDRVKELIKVSGYPVAPAELEALLLTHDAVADVAVIQIPHVQKGEVPRAYVVLKDTDQARATTDTAIYEWVQDRVAPYKRLDGGVVFTDTIPKSASGKILRRLLRDAVKAEMAKQ
jgi:4-coumarate--CoA ligase